MTCGADFAYCIADECNAGDPEWLYWCTQQCEIDLDYCREICHL
jgi:hypothetical protein